MRTVSFKYDKIKDKVKISAHNLFYFSRHTLVCTEKLPIFRNLRYKFIRILKSHIYIEKKCEQASNCQ